MTRIAIVLLGCLTAGMATGADPLSVLQANKSACTNTEGTATFRVTSSRGGGAPSEHSYQIKWRQVDGNSLVSYLNQKGQVFHNFLIKNGKGASYEDLQGKRPTVYVCIQKSASPTDNPLMYGLMLGDKWVADLVRDGTLKASGTDTSGRFRIEGSLNGFPNRLTLDPAIGYLAVESSYADPAGTLTVQTKLDRWKPIGTAFFPMHGTQTYINARADAPISITTEMTVDHLEVGTVKASAFDLPKLTPGSVYKDDPAGKSYVIGEHGEKLFAGNIGPGTGPQSVVPTMKGWVFLIVVAILAVCLVTFLRNRIQSPKDAA